MTTNAPDPNAPKPGGLLARLRGMMQSLKTAEAPPAPPADPAPAATPATAEEAEAPEAEIEVVPGGVPVAAPVAPPPARPCPVCDAPRTTAATWCDSCGYLFPPEAPAPVAAPAGGPVEATPNPAPAGPAVR